MAQTITFNNVSYSIPSTGDVSWGTNVSNYLVAIAAGALQLSGGAFPLTADATFGSSFGLQAQYYKSNSANLSATGILRLANLDGINWRNAANSADISLTTNAANQLQYSGLAIPLEAGSLTASRAVASDASSPPNLVSSATTAAELGFVSGVTSAIQTQLNARATGTITASPQFQLAYFSAAGTATTLSGDANTMAATQALVTDANGVPTTTGNGGTTATELGYVHLVTSAIQTQINSKQATLTRGQLPGDNTGSVASTGNVGEVIKSPVANVSAGTTAQFVTIGSIILSAGNWAISISGYFYGNSGTITAAGNLQVAISAFPGNTTTDHVAGDNMVYTQIPATNTQTTNFAITNWQVTTASTPTIYMKGLVTYTAGTPQWNGRITAVRIS